MQIIHCKYFTGGFYSDNLGHVAENCKKCPNGSFVAYDKAPGTRAQDCKSCPQGKKLFLVIIYCQRALVVVIYAQEHSFNFIRD